MRFREVIVMKRTNIIRRWMQNGKLLVIVTITLLFSSCDMFSPQSPFQSVPEWIQGTWETSSGETWKFDDNHIYHNGSDFGKELGNDYISSGTGYTIGSYQWNKFYYIYYAVNGGRVELVFNRDGAATVRLKESVSYSEDDVVVFLYRVEGPSIDYTIEAEQNLPTAFDFEEPILGVWGDDGEGRVSITSNHIIIDNIGSGFDISVSTATACPEFFSFNKSNSYFSLTFADPTKHGAPVYRLRGQLKDEGSTMYFEYWTISSTSTMCWYYEDLIRIG